MWAVSSSTPGIKWFPGPRNGQDGSELFPIPVSLSLWALGSLRRTMSTAPWIGSSRESLRKAKGLPCCIPSIPSLWPLALPRVKIMEEMGVSFLGSGGFDCPGTFPTCRGQGWSGDPLWHIFWVRQPGSGAGDSDFLGFARGGHLSAYETQGPLQMIPSQSIVVSMWAWVQGWGGIPGIPKFLGMWVCVCVCVDSSDIPSHCSMESGQFLYLFMLISSHLPSSPWQISVLVAPPRMNSGFFTISWKNKNSVKVNFLQNDGADPKYINPFLEWRFFLDRYFSCGVAQCDKNDMDSSLKAWA